jgi:hypothetical protein
MRRFVLFESRVLREKLNLIHFAAFTIAVRFIPF